MLEVGGRSLKTSIIKCLPQREVMKVGHIYNLAAEEADCWEGERKTPCDSVNKLWQRRYKQRGSQEEQKGSEENSVSDGLII